MGMAASQARLLSITSRMSDNELRAQLINNAKMRLTSDSAKVSDEYIAALNETQFMFSNFDTQGNEQYQNLTFNSLTAYSAFNNQYGITNSAGELLVASSDAANFEKSNSIEAFLGCYGLVQDTTYFDTYKNEEVGYYDTYGNRQNLGITVGNMKDIFEGNIDSNGVEHYGYADSKNSKAYGEYAALVADYQTAKSEYKSSINEQKNKFMNGQLSFKDSNGVDRNLIVDNKNFETIYNEVSSLSIENFNTSQQEQYAGYMETLMSILKDTNILKDTSSIFEQAIEINLGFTKSKAGTSVYSYQYEAVTYGYAQVDANGNITKTYTDSSNFVSKYYSTIEPETGNGNSIEAEGFEQTLYETNSSDPNAKLYYQFTIPDDNYEYLPLYKYEDKDGNIQYTIDSTKGTRVVIKDANGNNVPSITSNEFKATNELILESLQYVFSYFKDNAFANLNDTVFTRVDGTVVDKRNAYIKASQNLAQYIYGENFTNISEGYYDYLDDPSWVLSQNQTNRSVAVDYTYIDDDGNNVTYTVESTDIEKTHYNPNKYPTTDSLSPAVNINGKDYNPNYQVIKDIFLIECMIDMFGEPNYTWIDKNNPDENAEAKAQWYTNLYERMQDGYKEIPQNLMNSSEWLQFAFESGLVTMEQVDKSNKWNSTMYANCSNITESTVDVDITIAEAKYKREMNKIQAKDKQYDIELKNIDTEHNSLQTEYDSIKSVIEKNIDRNFKMFQA